MGIGIIFIPLLLVGINIIALIVGVIIWMLHKKR